jgi:hypothetical protein
VWVSSFFGGLVVESHAACFCRTIRPEALEPNSKLATEAQASLQEFLSSVSEELKQGAQQFRIEREERAR